MVLAATLTHHDTHLMDEELHRSRTNASNFQPEAELEEWQKFTPKPVKKWTKSKSFWISLFILMFFGALNPEITKVIYNTPSSPCSSADQDTYGVGPGSRCYPSPILGFMGTQILPMYFYQILLGSLAYYLLDVKFHYNKGKYPMLCTPEEIYKSKFYTKKIYAKFFLCSLFDIGFKVFSRMAVLSTRPSDVGMISSLQMLVSMIADVILLKRGTTVGRVLGLCIILCGVVVYQVGNVGIVARAKEADPDYDDSDMASNPSLGAIMAVLCAVSRGLWASFQTKNMTAHKMPPMKMVMVEAALALPPTIILYFIMIGIGYSPRPDLHFVPKFSIEGDWWQAVNTSLGAGMISLYSISGVLFQGSLIQIGKFVSGLTRMIMLQVVAILNWLLEVVAGLTTFDPICLAGWILSLFGVVVYGGIYAKAATKLKILHYPLYCGGCGGVQPPHGAIMSHKQMEKHPEHIPTFFPHPYGPYAAAAAGTAAVAAGTAAATHAGMKSSHKGKNGEDYEYYYAYVDKV